MRYVVGIEIEHRAEDIFAFLSDLRNELGWNPAAKRVTKLTPGLIAVGTRFEAEWSGVPATIVEMTAYQPPRTWETRSRSLGMEVVFHGALEPSGSGTRYVVDVTVKPHGWARLAAPLA